MLPLLCLLLIPVLSTGAQEVAGYGSTRELYERCGRAYAAGDRTAFLNALDHFIESRRDTPWEHEGLLTRALFLSREPQNRDRARQMLRKVAQGAPNLPFSRIALYLIGKMYEEEGLYASAVEQYRKLSEMPSLPDNLEKTDLKKSSFLRLPTYSVSTELANRLREDACMRLLYIDYIQPGTGRPLPPIVRNLGFGQVMNLKLQGDRAGTGEAFLVLAIPGSGTASLEFRAIMQRAGTEGILRIEARPLHPVDVGFHLPKVAVLPTDVRSPAAKMDFPKPYRVYGLRISWRRAWPGEIEVRTARSAALSEPKAMAGLVKGLFEPGTSAPFGRGAASIRLRYDTFGNRFLLLVAAPYSQEYNPAAPSNLFYLESRDGLNWGPPVLLPVSSMRDDLRPDFTGGPNGRLAWVSSRRGPGLHDLYLADTDNLANLQNVRSLVFKPEDMEGMPGGVEVWSRCPAFLETGGAKHMFLLSQGLGAGKKQGFKYVTNLQLKASSIYHLKVGVPPPDPVQAVLAAMRGGLDRYLGQPGPGEKSPFISEQGGISALVEPSGLPAVIWLSDNGIPAVSIRSPVSDWTVERILLQAGGGSPVVPGIRSLDAVIFKGRIHAVASVEGEGVVYYEGTSWRGLRRRKTLFADPVFHFHTSIAASPDPNGKVVAAYVPMGPYATGIAVEVVTP